MIQRIATGIIVRKINIHRMLKEYSNSNMLQHAYSLSLGHENRASY
jgi:hypothetical protein